MMWYVAACSLLFGFVPGGWKSWGIILVELQELFPLWSVASLLWLLKLPQIVGKIAGENNSNIDIF